MNSKKLVSAVLTATTMLWMVGASVLPVASAQTTSSLQAQIAALLAQIQQLQGQLNTSGTTTTTTYNFTSDLTVGSKGAQVSSLQQLLISKGFLTAVSAPTGYFGALTQKALGKWQASVGISPAAGYFGPKTRAFVNSMSSTTTGTGTSTSTTTTAPATGLAVSLASTNPAAGSLISSAQSGSARVPVLAVNFTAGNAGAATLSEVKFQKTGVLSDSAISGAYLTQNGQVVAQYNSLNTGVLDFSGLNLSIPAGQTVSLTLAIDISGGLSAGNTTGFALTSATAFGANNTAITPSGSFPLAGNVFTVTSVTNPSLATVKVASSSIGTLVTAGTQGNIVAAYNFTVGNSPVYLQNLNFHVVGSANVAMLQNVKLLVNGTQVGTTLSSVPSNGMADFNATAATAKLNTGSNNVQVVADVMGSPSYNFQFEILNGYDVLAVDSQYNVPVSVSNDGGIGTQVGIQQGQITVNQDASTPTGNIAKGQSGVVLAKYDVYAAGEPVKVKFLDFNINLIGASAIPLNQQIQNVSITDDAGNQVGTSINQPPSSNSCAVGANYTGSSTYNDCFGSSASPINYIVPANTTRVLSLKADIQTTASFSTITANLSGDTNNLQGMTSSRSGSTGNVPGVSLTLVLSSLLVSPNNALGSQNVSAGTTNLKIGSYAFSASSAEGVNINTLSVRLTPGVTIPAFQNLKALVNGTQFGTTQGVVSGDTIYSFSGAAFNIPAGQTVNVDVYADTLSAATSSFSPATSLTGYTGVGQTSYTSINPPTSNFVVVGQTVSFNGNPALTIAADSSNPPAGQIVQNSTGNTLAVYRFSETSNVENVKVTQLNVVDTVASSGVKAAFSNVRLYNGSTLLGTAASPVYDGTANGYDYNFTSFSTPLIVPQGNSVSLTLKGDAGSYTNGSLTDNTTQAFSVGDGSITGGSSSVAASSTLTVSIPNTVASSTYSLNVTANGITSPYTNVVINASTTSGQNAQIAAAIAANATTYAATLGLSSATNGGGVTTTLVSLGAPAMNASASIFTFSTVTTAANGTGVAGVAGVATYTTIARGATSNKNAIVTPLNPNGNLQTTLRSSETLTATPVVSTVPLPASFQQIGSVTITSNVAGDTVPQKLTLTFSGNGSNSTFLSSLRLKDANSNQIAPSTVASPVVTWDASKIGSYVVTGGSSYTFTVWGDLSTATAASGTGINSLTAQILTNTDYQYNDASTNGNLISLTPVQVPITVVSLSSVSGGQF
jgi:hypothetical protein